MTDQLAVDLASLRIDRSGSTTSRSSGSSARSIVWTLLGVASTFGIAAGVWFARGTIQTQLIRQEITTTEVAILSPSQAEVQLTATGYVVPQTTSKVGSKIGGRVARVFVKEGDDVKPGDVLARLDDSDQRSSVVAARTRVSAAAARVEAARANANEISQQVARQRALVASGAVGTATLDDLVAREAALKSAINTAGAEANAASADATTFRVGLKDREILAPIGGRIVSKPVTLGEYVGGVGGPASIAEIVDFKSLMVEVDVPEARLHMVKLGAPCEIVLDAYPNRRYRGTAAELGLRVNRSKATIVVKVKFDHLEVNVLPEMSARVSFLSKAISDDALTEAPKKVVGADAIAQRGGRGVVFVVDQGMLHAQPVKVGGPVGGSVELLDGPAPGARVVAKPTADMADGQRIKEKEK